MAPIAGPSWLDDLSLDAAGPPWLSMGLARVGADRWLVVDDARHAELAERRRLLAERHDEVFAALPGTDAASAEVLALVRAWLETHQPDLALPPDPPAVHPLEAAGRLVQEDLCLMVERDGADHPDRAHLDAACLCFPSHWRLADKIGRPAAEVHGPVPRYAKELSARVDRYLARLRPDVIGVRRNWSVHESPELFAPEPPRSFAPLPVGAVADGLWLRSERQTLRRLPASGAVLFTIRVQQVAMGALATRPDVAARLAARLRAQPAELSAMGVPGPQLDPLLGWLDSVR